jgi:CxxC motif-containing protein (DUF1111 family)
MKLFKPLMLYRVCAVVATTTLFQITTVNASTLREQLLSMDVGPELAGDATVPLAGTESFRQLVGNASMSERARFTFGKIQFNTEWDPAPGDVPSNDGLGPVFNAIACASCHVNNGRGSPPTSASEAFEALLVRLSIPGTNPHGGPKPIPQYGDQLQHRSVEGVPAEGSAQLHYEIITGQFTEGTDYELRKPIVTFTDLQFGDLPTNAMYSLRLANPIIGLGLLEAVPASTLEQLADPQDANKDGISGRTNKVWSNELKQEVIGRFGWKANVASVAEQNAGAALGDMGITTELFPTDNCAPGQKQCLTAALHSNEVEFQSDFFSQLNRYVRLIGVPAQRNSDDPVVQVGSQLFSAYGCVECHIQTLQTHTETIRPELANQTIHPYSDLLLHDMGEGLADGRPDFQATGSEWRTAPLWGIGLTDVVGQNEHYLHDGRARNLSEAILWHGGEAQRARDNFATAPEESRAALIKFLKSI